MSPRRKDNIWQRSGPGGRFVILCFAALVFSLLVWLVSANVRIRSETYLIPAPALTPIGMMAERGAGLDDIDAYISARGESLEDVSIQGRTSLMEAAFDGRHDLMRLLLDHGADPDFETTWQLGSMEAPDGREVPLTTRITAIECAVMAGDAEAIRILLAAGADPACAARLGESLQLVAERLDVPELLDPKRGP